MVDKIIIWGTGILTSVYERYIDLSAVVAFADTDKNKQGLSFCGRPIIVPEELENVPFDKLIIFTSRKYDEIYKYATDTLKIEKQKIYYWANYYSYYNIESIYKTIEKDCIEERNKILLDMGFHLQKNNVYVRNSILEVWACGIEQKNDFHIFRKLYRRVYADLNEIPEEINIKAVFMGRVLSEATARCLEKNLGLLLQKFQYIYFTLPYADTEQNCGLQRIKKTDLGIVREWKLHYEQLICIQTEKQQNIKIFIASHKAFLQPQDKIYIPLWLGSSEANRWGYQEDKEEPSISYLNPLINECTGLYWMWKHAKCDYIGIVHYRRYLVNKPDGMRDDILTEEQIKVLLNDYDLITVPLSFYPISIYEQLKITVEPAAFEAGYTIIKEIIMQRQPKYMEAFGYVMDGKSMFPCNMFITSKKIFDCYCEWLFSIIIEAAEQIEVEKFSAYSKRIIGFFAERLFTVWLVMQDLSIKEMPIWVAEHIEDYNTDITRLYL